MSIAKQSYVRGIRAMRAIANSAGMLSLLERHRESRVALWMRSLFAIYDIDDMTGLDLPWWTLDSIKKVDRFLRSRPDPRVFEYGSGASTVWLARRATQIVSVEHDTDWFPIVERKLASFGNATLKLVPPDRPGSGDSRYASVKPAWRGRHFRNYVHAIDSEPGSFDVIVIDGRARPACLEVARSRLKPDGLIVFDNSRRAPYRRAIASIGMSVDRTHGLTACLPYPDETTLLRPMHA